MKLLIIWSILIIISLLMRFLVQSKEPYMFGQQSSLNDSAISRNVGIFWLMRLGGWPIIIIFLFHACASDVSMVWSVVERYWYGLTSKHC